MNVWLKIGGALFAAVALFACGYKYAAALYEADIADMQAKHALALKDKTDEYRAKEQNQAKQLADAWDQLERARARRSRPLSRRVVQSQPRFLHTSQKATRPLCRATLRRCRLICRRCKPFSTSQRKARRRSQTPQRELRFCYPVRRCLRMRAT